MDVLVIGAMGLDVKGQVTPPLEMGGSSPGIIRRSPGGLARNIAENLARIGVQTTLISAVADDWIGCYLLEQARQAGIDTRHVLACPDVRTGTYLALIDQEKHLLAALDDMVALERITPRYLYDRRSLFRDAQVIAIDANLTPQTLETVFRLAERYGKPVCGDPTSTILAPRLRPYLHRLRLVTPNLREAGALLEEETAAAEPMACARRLVQRGVGIAIITLAERGLCYATADESGSLPAIAVPVADRTGVGDALTAGVIFGLLEHLPVSEVVRVGLAASALTLQCRETVCPTMNLETLYAQLGV